MYSVERGHLLFLNKIKRETTQNNTDKKGREEGAGRGAGKNEKGWGGADGCMICACVQTSTSITIKA